MTLKQQSDIEKLVGTNRMYRTVNYKFTGHTEVGDKIIFSTDVKPLVVFKDNIGQFLSELLPTTEPANGVVPAGDKSPISPSIVGKLTETLLASLKEIENAEGDENLHKALKKAGGKTKICNSLMGVARITMAAKKNAE